MKYISYTDESVKERWDNAMSVLTCNTKPRNKKRVQVYFSNAILTCCTFCACLTKTKNVVLPRVNL